ncbi:MAG: hypothetical protein A3K19_20960 [Lentisphaerae bacterium RIFOXYB12_FULL_65_16]|nr:MAG: hypothetical protein A3K18_16455 [Lentisphaerae bacterium RIFOXYA12_64_32]OGV84803.1 MAG: hypothetical protein A3K19_20960 [Lentisphaerae bacterium RIFOXYB12_FULL_65_16]
MGLFPSQSKSLKRRGAVLALVAAAGLATCLLALRSRVVTLAAGERETATTRTAGRAGRAQPAHGATRPHTSRLPGVAGGRTPDVSAPVAAAREFIASLQAPDTAQLRDTVRTAIGLGTDPDPRHRQRVINELPKTQELSPEELRALYCFLAAKDPARYGSTANNALKNDILTHLIRDGAPVPDEVLPLMLGMFYDSDQDRAWRDYVLQHFLYFVEQTWPDPQTPNLADDAQFTAVRDAYWDATRELDTSIAGTALIGLEFLSRSYAAFDRDEVLAAAGSIARSADACDAVRATAVQVCANARNRDVLPVAQQIARSDDAGVPLRMAAIAAIGDLGAATDTAFLARFIPNPGARTASDTRLQTAAASAIERIKRREAL